VNNNLLPINKVICGDAIGSLKIFPDNHFDSIVTDPPAGISFMGKMWDDDKGGRDKWIKWLSEVFIEAKRVLKPGSHALVWALPRTSHWTAMALEDAGFEIRDCIYHVFGSGFPKSMDISKQIDKQAGVERKVIGKMEPFGREKRRSPMGGFGASDIDYGGGFIDDNLKTITEPCTESAKQWSGWGTSLKPAVECWWLVRKPPSENTITENVLKWGVGGLNIDECRISVSADDRHNYGINGDEGEPTVNCYGKNNRVAYEQHTKGRFPANLIHDGSNEVLAGFPQTQSSKGMYVRKTGDKQFFECMGDGKRNNPDGLCDNGSASRFFYCAKPSRVERNDGLDRIIKKKMDEGRKEGNPGGDNPRNRGVVERANHHPTVKAQALMEYLIKLITPPNSIGLDMFAGSGSTLIAYKKLGHQYIGIEIDPEYCKIAELRLIANMNGNRSLDTFNMPIEQY